MITIRLDDINHTQVQAYRHSNGQIVLIYREYDKPASYIKFVDKEQYELENFAVSIDQIPLSNQLLHHNNIFTRT